MAAETNPIQPQPRPDRQAKWTVMVYMAAGDDAELDTHAVNDLREMERAPLTDGVNVVVQVNRFWPSRPQRYRITHGEARLERADIVPDEPLDDRPAARLARAGREGANMGDGDTLANFLCWAKRHYPADHYFLVLWGHAYGLGFGRDHGDAMTLTEIRRAIDEFRGKPDPEGEAPRLDLLGANACAISYAEAACELSASVDYLVASEIAVPVAGWPYESILACLARGPEGVAEWRLDAETLGRLVADRYVAQYAGSPGGERVAMSVLNLTRADELRPLVAELAKALEAVVGGTDKGAGDRRAQIRAAFLSTASGDVRPLLDLVDLATRLEAVCEDLSVLAPHPSLGELRSAAWGLKLFLQERKDLPASQAGSTRGGSPFISHTCKHPDLEDLHGVGIFAPFVADARDLRRLGLDAATPDTGRSTYEALSLVQSATPWAELVFDRLRSGLPDDIVSSVEGSGASTRADRSAVAQMLLSVDALFDTLDRRVAVTQTIALASLPASAAGAGAALKPEALDRLTGLQLLRVDEVQKMLEAGLASAAVGRAGLSTSSIAPPTWSGIAVGTSEQVQKTAIAFEGLEQAMADVEHTVRRTLTNGTFGLGPGLGLRDKEALLGPPDKEALLGLRDKEALLGPPDKEALLGLRDKEALLGLRDKEALLGAIAEASPAMVVGGLFERVTIALQALEAAASEAETVAAKALLAPPGAAGLEPLSQVASAKSRLERVFRGVLEASSNARRTVRRVVAHPTYGIGPGPQGVSVDDRRDLARASGLSSRHLVLL